MNHLFKYGYFISKIHQYPAKTLDLAVLFSLWTSCEPGKLCSIEEIGLKEIFDKSLKVNHLNGDFKEFLRIYTTGKDYAPILTYDGKFFHFDYFTLFIFMFYVFSLNKKNEGTQTLSGFQSLNNQRKKSAENFEKIIRKKFRDEGYITYPTEGEKFQPRIQGQSYEYDCVAINETLKIIVLVDAKYEDISPSSTVGETIVDQSVLDGRDGALLHTKEQHTRRQFFVKYCSKFPCHITNPHNYKIISLVVTKHIPLIKKHLTTHVISYEQFQNLDFKKINL